MGRPRGWLISQQVLQILPSDCFFVLSFLSCFSLVFAVVPAHTPWRLWWTLGRGSLGHSSLLTLQVAWPPSQLTRTDLTMLFSLHKPSVAITSRKSQSGRGTPCYLHYGCCILFLPYSSQLPLFAYCSVNISSTLQLYFSFSSPKFCS